MGKRFVSSPSLPPSPPKTTPSVNLFVVMCFLAVLCGPYAPLLVLIQQEYIHIYVRMCVFSLFSHLHLCVSPLPVRWCAMWTPAKMGWMDALLWGVHLVRLCHVADRAPSPCSRLLGCIQDCWFVRCAVASVSARICCPCEYVLMVKFPSVVRSFSWLGQLNGVVNIIYYTCEAIMYREPVGVVFIVLASLFSTFLVRPISSMFGLDGGQVASPEVYVLGIVGALLCIVNKPAARGISGRPPSSEVSTSSMLTPLLPVGSGEEPTCDERTEKESSMEKFSVEPAEDGGSGPIQVTNYHSIQQSQTAVAASVPSLGASATRAAWCGGDLPLLYPLLWIEMRCFVFVWTCQCLLIFFFAPSWARAREVSMEMLRILLPFGLLSFVASTWFVSQKFINDDWHMNVFGYTALVRFLPFFPCLFPLANRVGSVLCVLSVVGSLALPRTQDQVLLPLYIFPYLWVTDQASYLFVSSAIL